MPPAAPPPRQITVEVSENGRVTARRDDGKASADEELRLDATDSQLLRVWRKWLTRRPTGWEDEDVAAFGSLLFRALLKRSLWDLVTVTRARLTDGQSLRLVLAFAADAQDLAALPWEYLYCPAQTGRAGYFVATEDRVLLSRSVPAAGGGAVPAVTWPLRVLHVASQPAGVGDVGAADVARTLAELGASGVVEVHPLEEPATPDAVARALTTVRPDVLHFLGHGDYESEAGGRLALVDAAGFPRWLTGREVAEVLAGAPPRLVLLQSCVAAREDAAVSYAGTAPQLVRHGLPCVVAMQYAVTTDVATTFAAEFYRALAETHAVDAATQRARRYLSGPLSAYHDPRLIGLPVVYARRAGDALTMTGAAPAVGGGA